MELNFAAVETNMPKVRQSWTDQAIVIAVLVFCGELAYQCGVKTVTFYQNGETLRAIAGLVLIGGACFAAIWVGRLWWHSR